MNTTKLLPKFVGIAGAILLLLTALAKLMPDLTKGILPLGGSPFNEVAIVLIIAVALALLIELINDK